MSSHPGGYSERMGKGWRNKAFSMASASCTTQIITLAPAGATEGWVQRETPGYPEVRGVHFSCHALPQRSGEASGPLSIIIVQIYKIKYVDLPWKSMILRHSYQSIF